LVILLALVLLWNCFYQVQPEEVGIVIRFGEYLPPPSEPGLNWKIPFVDGVTKVEVQRQQKEEFGFQTVTAGVRTQYSRASFLDESLMLTGDLNVGVVEWIVQYRVTDPFQYLFKVRNVKETFRDLNEAVMREIVGDRTVTEVLTVGRQEVEVTAVERLQELCNQYETGISIDQVVLQDVNPPDQVKASWDEVNQAQQQMDRLINEARAEYNQVIPRAKGEAEQTILQAKGYALARVNESQGDAKRFNSLYQAYRSAPQVTRQRMYLETMQKVLPKLGGKLFVDEDAKGVLPLLPLERFQSMVPGGDAERRDSR
jgi:membrane protease subunit HflK